MIIGSVDKTAETQAVISIDNVHFPIQGRKKNNKNIAFLSYLSAKIHYTAIGKRNIANNQIYAPFLKQRFCFFERKSGQNFVSFLFQFQRNSPI